VRVDRWETEFDAWMPEPAVAELQRLARELGAARNEVIARAEAELAPLRRALRESVEAAAAYANEARAERDKLATERARLTGAETDFAAGIAELSPAARLGEHAPG
jgi:hypothetical protein